MSSSTQTYENTNESNLNSCLIRIIHRNKNYTVKFIDFSNKSSYKEVIGRIRPFEINIDDALETNSVDALIQHINTRNTDEIINEDNIFDLNYLAHWYGFYILQAATSNFLLSKIPVSSVFEAFESRKSVEGYLQSFTYYFTHNFEIFVRDPSFYSLPFSVIEKMVDFNAPELTANDIVQLTINTYYVHGPKSLSLLEKANNCKSIYNTNSQKQDEAPKKLDLTNNSKSKSNLRNAFYRMIDAEDNINLNSTSTNDLAQANADKDENSDNDNNNNNNNNNDNDNDNNNNNKDLFNIKNNTIDDLLFSNNSSNSTISTNSNYDKENFSVNSDIYTKKVVVIKRNNKPKRGGKILEKECSTELLIKLYATIAKDRPYPYTQYLCNILSKRKKVTPENTIQKDMEELRYNISSVYIALLETTQGNKNAAYILLTSFFESGKADFMNNIDIVNLYKNLSDISPPNKPPEQPQQIPLTPQSSQSSQSQLQLQQIRSSSLRFSFSFNDMNQNVASDFDKRLLEDDFDWGAHGLYILYRIYHEGLYDQKKDESKAQFYLKRSADRNYKEAYFKLASFIVLSRDFLNIREDKLDILKKAADFGNGDYQFALACNLAERTDKLRDHVNAAYYFKLAMLSGHPNARANFERLQCDVYPPSNQQCKQLFTRITTEKIDLKIKLSILKRIADCGFDQAIIMYPTFLSEIDCTPLNAERPMDEENQIREVNYYMQLAIKKNMKFCHSVLGLFTLRKVKNSKDVIGALNILSEGSNFRLPDSIVLYSQLLLRMLGRGYRQPELAIKLLHIAASYNYTPALLELSSTFLYGVDVANVKADSNMAMEALRTLYSLKEPVGSARYLYIALNDTNLSKSAISSRINELKSIAEFVVKNKTQLTQSKSDSTDLKTPAKREEWADIPLWLYAKVMLEGKSTETDFKAAVSMLKKAESFPPAMVLLVSLSFQFSGIVKTGFQLFNLPLFSTFSNLNSSSKDSQNDQPLPKNYDSSYLPLPSATSDIIERFANQGDPTFRYKLGSIMLDEDEDSEDAFQLIRQSAYAGSICGMMKYGLLRLEGKFRPRNEYEAIEMFRKAGTNGLDAGLILYANYAMKYKELRTEVVKLLQTIRVPSSPSGRINFVARRGTGKGCSSDEIKLRLQLGKSLCLHEGTSLQESQYHLTSLISQYSHDNSNDKTPKISQIEYAEALFYYGKLLEITALNLTKNDTSVIGALEHFLKSYSNGYKPAIEAYVSLLLKIGNSQTAIDFLLDNLSKSTFALYKIGSMTLFTWPGESSVIAEGQAIDLMKLATMLDDSHNYPDLLWKFGTMLRDGFYVAKDEQAALSYFYEAAECGSQQAVIAVGNQALKTAILADKRSKDSQNMIETLSISDQNKKTAFECFRSAAQGDNSIEASWLEAMCLLRGIGVYKDKVEAVKILLSLAQKSDRDALYKLGKIAFNYSKGGPEGSNSTKVKLFQLGIHYIASAAQLGHSTAIWRLGLLILQGQCNKGTAVNILNTVVNFNFLNASSEKVAVKLFEISANSGNLRGASLFSLCLENGIGIDRNIQLAKLYASPNYMESIIRK